MDNRQIVTEEKFHHEDYASAYTAKRILILFDAKITFLGNFCQRIDKLRYIKSYFEGASIHINFSALTERKFYESLLLNNPYIDQFTSLPWEDIDFLQYDTVFVASYEEEVIRSWLLNRYGALPGNVLLQIHLFSVSSMFLPDNKDARYVLPVYRSFMNYLEHIAASPGELYISREERQWANSWLEGKGFKKHEKLAILLDTTSRRHKLLDMRVYFEFLSWLLDRENMKVLVFDEKNMGKEAFYKEWLSPAHFNKMIFAKGNGLREDLRLLASEYTKLVFGPCTGLIHCTSSIYNHFVEEGMNAADVPLIITYTGCYLDGKNAWDWWGAAPLVSCLLLREKNNRKKMVLLNDLSPEEKRIKNDIHCSEYTTDMLIDFVRERMPV